ncbi:unnamed protein product [Litomosoides sigmodontis]|uniref:Uncharacterized protein n=1 Tax=Litomosoides sigmodontis TaxID=42156 RepID=A0A3P6T2X1_LITSI|nr:unnamed protein product [Litomosoides sigmodontis]
MRGKLLSLITSERKNSLDIVVWLENCMKTVEASIAVHPEMYNEKDNGNICVQIEDLKTTKQSASFESKSRTDEGEMNFAGKWYKTSKESKSRTVQAEVERILVNISCQVKDFNNGTSASEKPAKFSLTNTQNEVVIAQKDAGTKSMSSFCQALDQDVRKTEYTSTGNGSFSLYTFPQTEGITKTGDVRSKYSTLFAASMQTEYGNEFTELEEGIEVEEVQCDVDIRSAQCTNDFCIESVAVPNGSTSSLFASFATSTES